MCKGFAAFSLVLHDVTGEDGTPITEYDQTIQGGYDNVAVPSTTDDMPIHLIMSDDFTEVSLEFSPNDGKDIVGSYTYEVIYEYATPNASGI